MAKITCDSCYGCGQRHPYDVGIFAAPEVCPQCNGSGEIDPSLDGLNPAAVAEVIAAAEAVIGGKAVRTGGRLVLEKDLIRLEDALAKLRGDRHDS